MHFRLMSQAPTDSPPVIVGGLSSGRGSDLLFHPGRFVKLAEEGQIAGWDPLADVQKSRCEREAY